MTSSIDERVDGFRRRSAEWVAERTWLTEALSDLWWAFVFSALIIQDRNPMKNTPVVLAFIVLSAGAVVASRRYPWPAYGAAVASTLVSSATGFGPNWGIGALVVCGAQIFRSEDENTRALSQALCTLDAYALVIIPRLLHWPSSPVFRGTGAHAPQQLLAAGLIILATSVRANWNLADVLRIGATKEAETAVEQERSRIARELHDVVAHQLTVVTTQAQGAEAVLASDPGRATAALHTISTTSRDALVELRRLLGVLRRDESTPDAGDLGRGFRDLDRLETSSALAGITVNFDIEDNGRDVPTGIEVSVYRIVQEALTNVAKHAPGATAEVGVRVRDGEVVVDVVNGPGDARRRRTRPSGSKVGLIGMKERAELLGGSLRAGATPDGGWSVVARFPLDAKLKA